MTEISVGQDWHIFWNGYDRPNSTAKDRGECYKVNALTDIRCEPKFFTPYWVTNTNSYAQWNQKTRSGSWDGSRCQNGSVDHDNSYEWNCGSSSGFCGEDYSGIKEYSSAGVSAASIDPSCCDNTEASQCTINGGVWDDGTCTCISPIVIDVAGNGFNLTDASGGVLFDMTRDGVPDQVSWTSANSDDAWLVLDRNGNGAIDDGKELFGSSTPQPYLSAGESKNGFRALAMFDQSTNGGNDDGQIDDSDAIFSALRLWQDVNHNGVSESGELHRLADLGVVVIQLNYKESKRHDESGNWFRYRAKVGDAKGAQPGRWAWDVYLQVAR